MRQRQTTIDNLKLFLSHKAIFAANASDPEDHKKLINEYNKLLGELNDELSPENVLDRKKYASNMKDRVKALKGKTMQDLFPGKELKLGKKSKNEFNKTISSKTGNWGKVN